MPQTVGDNAVIISATGINGNQNPLPFTITSVGAGNLVNGHCIQDGANPDGTGQTLYLTGVQWFSTSAAAVAYIAANYIDGGADILCCYDYGT